MDPTVVHLRFQKKSDHVSRKVYAAQLFIWEETKLAADNILEKVLPCMPDKLWFLARLYDMVQIPVTHTGKEVLAMDQFQY